jgi:hypothetical protein
MQSRANQRVAAVAVALVLIAATCQGAANASDDAWRAILAPMKLTPEMCASIILPSEASSLEPAELRKRVEQGAVAILEGASPAAESFGIRPTAKNVRVYSVLESREPRLSLIWEHAADVPIFEMPKEARVFTKERSESAPLVAGIQIEKGAVLWLATDPGAKGHERYPYLLHALRDLGLQPPVNSKRLTVFLDTSYRMRVDVDYMARQWRRNGIASLHIAAWHYFEPDEQRDGYLRRLIGAAHRNAIHVYAWVELPHVSERFWNDHPEWREKTATGADAHLDWRKLMNLRNRECGAAVKTGVEDLLRRFDWDGVNLAELYFESLEGHANPSRFTPLNNDVRKEFQKLSGFDPNELFMGDSVKHWSKNASGLMQFLNYRTELATSLQREWMGTIDALRTELPHLDLVLTHVDNLLDPTTRERIGADATKLLPLLDQQDFTFLIEDPATAWALGPERYPRIAGHYAPLVKRKERLGIDINVVERYQDVYPTKQQVGTEMFQEIHLAAGAFSQVALYFETSIRRTDWPLVGAAAAAVKSMQRTASGLSVDLTQMAGVRWTGPARVDGQPWPYTTEGIVWLPPGNHSLEAGTEPEVQILDLNAELRSAWLDGGKLSFSYDASTRALAVLSKPLKKLWIDGVPTEPKVWIFDQPGQEGWVLVLPRGQHVVTVQAL